MVHIPQGLYSHRSKKSSTRYSHPLDNGYISFCPSGTSKEGILLQDALDSFASCTVALAGAKDVVLQNHPINITLHIMVCEYSFAF